ncbi:MAG: hypothetical protein JRM90_04795, partial [Nitrososphaerota archaeon]|nr:hypothetical protein [Nitrososphaerota archaeon]
TKQGRMVREVFVTRESAEMASALILRKFLTPERRLLSYSTREFREKLYRVLPKMGLGQRIEGHRYWQIHPPRLQEVLLHQCGRGDGRDCHPRDDGT